MATPLHFLSLAEMSESLLRRDVTATELTQAHLERIEAVEERVGAYLTLCGDSALAEAEAADARLAAGHAGLLTGIPMQLKDNISTAGVRTTCASAMLRDYVPPYDATVATALRQAGTVLLGKGNMDEFAMGSSTENSALGKTANPWDLERVPGGSSGGPAAAVAAGEAAFALGSDTGGSIRQPAALCGIVGLKPTYGLVSRNGLVAFASSLDQIGPMTRTVEDAALVLNAIATSDAQDSTSIAAGPHDYTAGLRDGVAGLRIGVVQDYFGEGIEPTTAEAARAAIAELESQGAAVDWDVRLPSSRAALAAYYVIAPSECSANLARYDGVKYGHSNTGASGMWDALQSTRREGFGPEVKRRIMLGTYALSSGYYDAYYLKALRVRTLIRDEFREAFERFDVLATPSTPSPAFRLGEKADDPVAMHASDVCNVPVNIAGIPAITVPCGFVDGLPVGLQLLGPHLSEATLLGAAYAYEQATDWRERRPVL